MKEEVEAMGIALARLKRLQGKRPMLVEQLESATMRLTQCDEEIAQLEAALPEMEQKVKDKAKE